MYAHIYENSVHTYIHIYICIHMCVYIQIHICIKSKRPVLCISEENTIVCYNTYI